jgi:uncharacterized membrane protein
VPEAQKSTSPELPVSAPSLYPVAPGAAPPWPPAQRWQKPVFLLFLLAFALNETLLLLRVDPPAGWRWVEGLFLVSAALSALLSLAQRLPLQNVLMAAVLTLCLAGLVVAVARVTGVPFGPFIYGDALGPRWFETVPWSVPVLWLILIVNGRGVARLIMRPWRKTNYYGFWVMGLTALLAVHFDLVLEPFAVKLKHYWLWLPTQTHWQWYTAPWVNFLGWFAVTLAILVFTLPWLINKQPVKRPMDYHPLIQWMILHLWVCTGNVLCGFRPAWALGLSGCLVTAGYAVRGARW